MFLPKWQENKKKKDLILIFSISLRKYFNIPLESSACINHTSVPNDNITPFISTKSSD